METDDRPVRRLGILGGTFDPIHVGHLIAASEALHRFELDLVMFVPAGQPWQKRAYSDPEDRFLMTALGASSHRRFVVSRIELDRPGPTYTGDTLESIRSFYGSGVKLFFLAGADAVLNLGTWKTLDVVAQLCEVIAITRPRFDLSGMRVEPSWPPIHTMDMPGIDVSATEIRERIRDGKPVDYLVPSEVLGYIRERGLYTGVPETNGGGARA